MLKHYYKDKNIELHYGHVLDVLKILPSASVDCVMTSPPYWALRDYGSDPQVWDGDENCKHEWGENIMPRGNKSGKPGPNATVGARFAQDNYRRGVGTNFCEKCGAWKGELGLEPAFELYIKHLCDIFNEIKRVLKSSGTCWVNLGDTYGGSGGAGGDYNKGGLKEGQPRYNGNKEAQKSLCQIPSRFAIEMVNRGWILRNEIIWYKPNCMPSSATDRFTVDFEKLFFFVKNKKYYFEQQIDPNSNPLRTNYTPGKSAYQDNIYGPNDKRQHRNTGFKAYAEGKIPEGKNKRTVWKINTCPFPESHFAVYPEELCETPIKAGCPKDGIVLDMFHGSGTTGKVARKLGRKYIGIDINKEYLEMSIKTRLKDRYLDL